MATSKIIWTKIDEAPALATFALLPIVQAYAKGTGVDVETRDISLTGRIIANFPDKLTAEQKIPDNLAQLGELTQSPEANIIKLPNISASIPQLQSAIKELQDKGYDIPSYPEEPKNDAEKALQVRFAKVLENLPDLHLAEGFDEVVAIDGISAALSRQFPRGSSFADGHEADEYYISFHKWESCIVRFLFNSLGCCR